MKKRLGLAVMLSLLLVACKDEDEQKDVEMTEEKQEEIAVVSAENDFLQYEWKTTYHYILNRYINDRGFWNIWDDSFPEKGHGIAAAKLIEDNGRDVPYLAVLYEASDSFELDRYKRSSSEFNDTVFYFDIWAIQNGEPVRIKQEEHREQGTAGDLSFAFVETMDGETMLHYGSKTSTGELHGYLEEYYSLQDLENPAYLLNHFITVQPDGTSETTFVVNKEVSDREYEKNRKRLMGSSIQWIDSDLGEKSISDEVAPIIPNVLDVLDLLETEKILPEELLALEKQAIYDKLVNVNYLEDNLTDSEKVEFAKNYGMIRGGIYTEDNLISYPKRAMDYFTQSYFGFTLDETIFASEPTDIAPAFKDDVYMYPIVGDSPSEQDVYVLDILEIEKLEGALYGVKYEEKFFEWMYYVDGDYESYPFTHSVIFKRDLPIDASRFIRDQRTGYAIFEKNKYGFAIIEDSTTATLPSNEKEEYLAAPTFTQAVDLL